MMKGKRKGDRMDQDTIIEAIRTAAQDNHLSCATAHELARKLNIKPEEIGEICNRLKIKITACRLGCF
jgi:hypothetical protein